MKLKQVILNGMLLMLALLFNAELDAQNVNIRNGASFKIGSFEFVEEVLSVNNDGSSTVLMKAGFFGNKFRVLNLDKSLAEASKFEVEIPKVENKKVKYFASGQYGDHVYFMSTLKNRKAKTYTLYASELDPKNGKFIKHHKAAELKYDKFLFGNPYSVERSVDSTKILIIARYPMKLKEPAKYKLTVLNNDMSELWSKDIDFPQESKYLVFDGALVDKFGNAHLLVTEKMSKDEQKDNGKRGLFADKWRAELYSYYHEDGKLVHYDLEHSLSDKVVQNIHLTTNDNGDVIGVGFYSDKKFWGQGYSGFYSMRIDPKTKEVVSANASPFSDDLKAELIGVRKASKGKDIPKYIVRRVIPLDNGKMAVVTEHYVYTKRTTTDKNGNQHTTETWLFGNVLVMYLDENGVMESSGVLKKKQLCTARDGKASIFQKLGIGAYPGVNELPYYGIAIMEVDNKIHIIFNDNPKNSIRLQDGKKPKSVRQRNAVTELVTFSAQGKVMRNTLFKAKDADAGYKMPIMPRQSVQYSKNDMIIFGRKKKNFRVLGVTIK
jgi:hypothetical protein